MTMSDEKLEQEIVKCFDIFGQALFLSFKAAVRPASGQIDAMRGQWRNLGRKVIELVKETR